MILIRPRYLILILVSDAQLFKEAWLKAQKENEVLFAQAAQAKTETEESEPKAEEKKEEPAASS